MEDFLRHEKDKKLKHIVIKDVSFRPKQRKRAERN